MKLQITFLGANSLFGRVSSALLRQTPSVGKLKLYDEQSSVHPGPSTTESSCLVQWHRGKEQLIKALEGSDIIVIGDDNKITGVNEKDSIISTASRVVDYVFAIAHTVPKAMLVVAASPLNLMVPLAGYVLKELGCYDGRKLLGVTSTDTLRANALYSAYLRQTNSILPVVGGASPQTRVPIFSHAKPYLEIPEEDQNQLIEQIRGFDHQMEGQEYRASTIERAYATVRMVNTLISGILEEPNTAEMALAKTNLIPEVNYFSLPVNLGKTGIERTFGLPQLSPFETEMIDYAVVNLNNDLMKAHDLYSTFKPCLDMVKSITGTPRSECCDGKLEDLVNQSEPIKKENLSRKKCYKRKRIEPHSRNRKKSNKSPILHCPAPDVVPDRPKSEKFRKIKRMRKRLEIDEIVQGEKTNLLPALRFTATRGKFENRQSAINLKKTDNLSKDVLQATKTNTTIAEVNNKKTGPNIRPIPQNNLRNKSNERKVLFKAKCTEIEHKPNETVPMEKPKTKRKKGLEKDRKNNVIITKAEASSLKKTIKYGSDMETKTYDSIKGYFKPDLKKASNFSTKNLKPSVKEKVNPHKELKNITQVNNSENKNYLKENEKQHLNDIIKQKKKHISTINNKISKQKDIAETLSIKKPDDRENMKSINTINHENSVDSERRKIVAMKNSAKEESNTEEKTIEGEDKKESESIKEANKELEQNENGEINMKNECNTKSMTIEKSVPPKNQAFIFDNDNLDQTKNIEYEERKLKNDRNHAIKPIISELKETNEMLTLISTNDNIKTNNKIEETNGKEQLKTVEKFPTELETNNENENNNRTSYGANNHLSEDSNHIPKENGDEKLEKDMKCAIDKKNTDEQHFFGVPKIALEHEIKENLKESKNSLKQEQEIKSKLFTANINDSENKAKGDITEETVLNENKKINDFEKKEEKEVIRNKVFIAGQEIFDEGNKIVEIDAQKKLKEIEHSLKKENEDKDIHSFQNNVKDQLAVSERSMYNTDPSEQRNKIRAITQQKLKDPYQELISSLKKEDKEITKGKKKNLVKTKLGTSISQLPENIHSFNYQPNPIKDTRNITNIDDMIHNVVKEYVEDIMESTADKKEKNTSIKETVFSCEGALPKDKVAHIMEPSKPHQPVHLNSNEVKISEHQTPAGNILNSAAHKLQDGSQKKNDQRATVNTNAERNQRPNASAFPLFFQKDKSDENGSFHKNIWSKPKTPQSSVRDKSPTKVNLDNVLESKKVSINSYNIDESFTKRGLKKTNQTINIPNNQKPISYTIDTKRKRDELSKRYTVLKKGQISTMIKEDLNANELINKFFEKSVPKTNHHMNPKHEASSALDAKEFEINKNTDMNMTDIKRKTGISETSNLKSGQDDLALMSPSSRDLELKEYNYPHNNTTTDIIRSNSLKKINKNSISLKNKSFLNLVLNRISKRAPSLNETTETISKRESHNAPISHDYRKPLTSDESNRINQQLIKKAKEQLNMTKMKNKKGFIVINENFPVVSKDIGSKSPNSERKIKGETTKHSAQKSMADIKNKMQILKDRYQYLKSTRPTTKNYKTPGAMEKKRVSDRAENKETGMISISNKTVNKITVKERGCSLTVASNTISNTVEKNNPVTNDDNKLQKESNKGVFSLEKTIQEKAKLDSTDKQLPITISGKNESVNEINPQFSFGKPEAIDDSCGKDKIDFTDQEKRHSETSSNPTVASCSNDKAPEPINKPLQQVLTEAKCKNPNEQLGLKQQRPKSGKQKSNISKLSKTEESKIKVEKSKIKNEKPKIKVTKPSANIPRSPRPFTPRKKVFHSRAQMDHIFSPDPVKPDEKNLKSLHGTFSTKQIEKSDCALDVISDVKKELLTLKPGNEKANIEPEALNIFANRTSSKDLPKIKKEQKPGEAKTVNARQQSDRASPSLTYGFGGTVVNKLVPKQSSATILLDPNHEKRTISRKEIPPSLMHAVKPFASLNANSSKPTINFHLRWSPQSSKTKKENKMKEERDAFKSQDERLKKNPFVYGKINMTSDIFKEYMKKNRNNDFNNSDSNGDISFLNTTSRLAIAPPQSVSTKTKAIKDQRVTFCTLKAYSDKENTGRNKKPIKYTEPNVKKIARTVDGIKSVRPSTAHKSVITGKPTEEEANKKRPESSIVKKNNPYKPYPPNRPPYLTLYNKTTGKSNMAATSFRNKEEELKRMHLLKAFQDQEKTEQKLEELQRNFKKQKQLNSESSLKSSTRVRTLFEPKPIERSPKRLHMLKAFSKESLNQDQENNRRVQRPFSAPPAYHPSFPLSKPKKTEIEKNEETPSSPLKKRWTQLLDIFQSVITSEKKNWEHDETKNNLLLTDGEVQAKDNARSTASKDSASGNKRTNVSAKKVQSYYRRYST